MSFISTYPTNLVKLAGVPGYKSSYETGAGKESVSYRYIEVFDRGSSVEASRVEVLIRGSDTGALLEVSTISLSAKERGSGIETWVLKKTSFIYVSEAARGLEARSLTGTFLFTVSDSAKGTEVSSPKPRFEDVLECVAGLRKVSYGDFVVADDFNRPAQCLKLLYSYLLSVIRLRGGDPSVLETVKPYLSMLRRVRSGDLILPEDHNLLVDAIKALVQAVESTISLLAGGAQIGDYYSELLLLYEAGGRGIVRARKAWETVGFGGYTEFKLETPSRVELTIAFFTVE